VEVIHISRSQRSLHRREDGAERNSQAGRLLPINVDVKLWNPCPERGLQTLQRRLGISILNDFIRDRLQLCQALVGAVLQPELESPSLTETFDRRRREGEDNGFWNLRYGHVKIAQ